jgi:pimeloyl-ACP methyl ester carboxylesterase
MTLKGTVQPTVVLQSGLGDGKESWAGILDEIARSHQVVAYDRPGYGESSPTAAPRDPCSVAREMHAMLHAAQVPPPYLLVGHSLGGLYQYAFAKLYPDEVAGLLLLDPTHPDHWQRMQIDAPSAATVLKGLRYTVFSRTARAEFDQQAVGLDAIDRSAPLHLPVRHLVRTQYQAVESGAFETLVHTLEQDWSRLLGTSQIVRVEGSGHYLHHERPAVVLAALQSLDTEIAQRHARELSADSRNP